MTRMNEANELQRKANENQEKNNEIQEELKEVIRTYNKVTSRHNIVMWVLTAIIALLTIATLLCNKTGRYAISTVDKTGVYVLDTKTSQLWCRDITGSSYCLGTNKKPEGIRQINK